MYFSLLGFYLLLVQIPLISKEQEKHVEQQLLAPYIYDHSYHSIVKMDGRGNARRQRSSSLL